MSGGGGGGDARDESDIGLPANSLDFFMTRRHLGSLLLAIDEESASAAVSRSSLESPSESGIRGAFRRKLSLSFSVGSGVQKLEPGEDLGLSGHLFRSLWGSFRERSVSAGKEVSDGKEQQSDAILLLFGV